MEQVFAFFIMANFFFYGCSGTRHLPFCPYLPTPQVTISLLFAGSEVEDLPHHTLRGKLHIYHLLFTSIQNYTRLYLLVYRETLVQANEQKCLSKLIVALGFYVPECAPLQLIERTL